MDAALCGPSLSAGAAPHMPSKQHRELKVGVANDEAQSAAAPHQSLSTGLAGYTLTFR
jgi:hypothetical protein